MNDKLIMVADDVEFMRRMICMTLTEMGIENVVVATDGHEAVEMYEETHPDLVLLDITMDGKNGLEALSEIMEVDPEACVIMCTAVGQQQTIVECVKLGAYDYIVKPFQKDKLMETVRHALDAL